MAMIAAETSIAARFREVAASMPGAPALIAPRGRYTYADLDRWSDAVAAAIVDADAPLDAPVAILTHDPVLLVPAVLGAVKAGHFFVVIDATDPEERVSAILNASQATLRLTDADINAGSRVSLGGRRSPHSLVQLLFTSGTTGVPKAVASGQHGFAERLVRASARTGRAAGERVSYTALPGFARATGEIFGALLNGATLCAFDARAERLDALAAMIERERVSTLTLTPALFRRFMRTLPASTDLSSVRKLRIGADVMTVADVDAWRARFPRTTTLERAFNATETGMVLHLTIDHDTPIPGPLVPMGRPLPGVEVRIVDEADHDVPDGETGELIVRGPHVAQGYWNAPELTAEKFIFEPGFPPAFRTGDLVRRDAEGLLYFIGRRDSRLKIHGRRIDPLEIESALVALGGARDAAAVARRSADGESRLVAYVVLPDGANAGPRELRAALRGKVPAWMIPARIHLLDALPMTRSGKVDREALANREDSWQLAVGGWREEASEDDANALSPANRQPPTANSLEETLLAIWSHVLHAAVRRDDDFFDDLGGESLDAAQLVSEVHRVTGRSLPLSLLIELNTVAKMAAWLRARPDVDQTVVAIQREGSRPPLFCVSGKGGSVIVFRRLAALLGNDQPFYGLTHHGIDAADFPASLAAIAAVYVEAIRAVQPRGPYHLAGYSAGGCVAYEMARQLTAAGEQVAFVGLIDTAAGGMRAPGWRRSMKYLAVLRRRPFAASARYARAVVRRAVRLGHWLRSGGREPLAPAPAPELVAINRFFDSMEMKRALQPYSGPVTLFLARQGRGADRTTPDAGWAPLCGDSLEVIEIEGEHHSVLGEDVAFLADALSRALTRARVL